LPGCGCRKIEKKPLSGRDKQEKCIRKRVFAGMRMHKNREATFLEEKKSKKVHPQAGVCPGCGCQKTEINPLTRRRNQEKCIRK